MGRSTKINGEKLRQARERLGLTQSQLGGMLDPTMSDENIGRLERGNPTNPAGVLSKRVPEFARIFNIPLDQFRKEFVLGPDNGTAAPMAATHGRLARDIWHRLREATDLAAKAQRCSADEVAEQLIALIEADPKHIPVPVKPKRR
jgi:transcriptional regulator with XRE-family HTH domain